MFKNNLKKLRNKYDVCRKIQIIFAVGMFASVIILIVELVIPLKIHDIAVNNSNVNTVGNRDFTKITPQKSMEFQEMSKIIRAGLFKSESTLNDKPMADKTIQRIRSQLKLQCVMELNGEPVAYVGIKGIGLKKCRIGDSIDDLFTVLDIKNRSIEITIVGHREILSL